MIAGLHAKGSSYGLMMYNFTKTLDGINNTLCDRALRAALRLEPSLSLNEGISLPDHTTEGLSSQRSDDGHRKS